MGILRPVRQWSHRPWSLFGWLNCWMQQKKGGFNARPLLRPARDLGQRPSPVLLKLYSGLVRTEQVATEEVEHSVL